MEWKSYIYFIVFHHTKVGDEAMIAVLGMFNPTLLGITDNNHYVIQESSKSLPEDPYDEEFLRETSVNIK